MTLTYFVLFQVTPTPRPPIAMLALVALLVLAALGLAIFLYSRFKRSDKEVEEEDWKQARHTLMLQSEQSTSTGHPEEPSAAQPDRLTTQSASVGVTEALFSAGEEVEHVPEPDKEPMSIGLAEAPRAPVEAERPTSSVIDELRAVATGPTESPTVGPTTFSEVPQPEATSSSSGIKTVPPKAMGIVEEAPHPTTPSPFGDEIWAELQDDRPSASADLDNRTLARVAAGPAKADLRVAPDRQPQIAPPPAKPEPRPSVSEPLPEREPFEPPRIEPIVPRKLAQSIPIIAPTARPLEVASRVAGFSEDARTPIPDSDSAIAAAKRVTAEITGGRPTSLRTAVAVAEPPVPDAFAEIPLRKPATAKKSGDILGLPATPSDKPLVFGESAGSTDVGTLARYGKDSNEPGGHGGTITLAVVAGVVAILALTYLFVPRVHTSVNGWIAKVRGISLVDQTPKVQIFRGLMDNTKNPVKVTGTIQNVSKGTLSGLKVVISLQPNEGNQADTIEAPVTPTDVGPGQPGNFDFDLDVTKYKAYKFSGLKAGDGSDVLYTTPAQQ